MFDDLLMLIIGFAGGIIGRFVLMKRYLYIWKNPGPSPLANKNAQECISTISKVVFFGSTLPLMVWMIFFFYDIFNPMATINKTFSLIRALLLLVVGIGNGYAAIYTSCVLDIDCDVEKYSEMMDILDESERAKGKRGVRSGVSRTVRKAYCQAIMDDDNYFENTMQYLEQAATVVNPEAYKRIYMDVRLHLFARYGDLNELIGCDQYLAQFGDKRTLHLREEALIHIYMLQGYYGQVKELINKQMNKGDSVLAHVYMEYYLARIAIEEGDIDAAREHCRYVFDFGGTTFYKTALKNYIIAKNVDIEVPFSNI